MAARLGWKEILRASNPGRDLLYVLGTEVSLVCLAFLLLPADSTIRRHEEVRTENAFIETISNPEALVDERARMWFRAARNLIDIIEEEEKTEPFVKVRMFSAYTLLHKEGIGPDRLRNDIEPFFTPLFRSEVKAYVMALIENMNTLPQQLTASLYGNQATEEQKAKAGKLVMAWPIFPISSRIRQAYAELDENRPADIRKRELLYELSDDIVKSVHDGPEKVLRTLPEVREVPTWKWAGATAVGLALTMSIWTWCRYLKTIGTIGIRPWHVRWSILTCLAGVFWAFPVVSTVTMYVVETTARRAGRIVWALLTADFGRAASILLRGKDAVDIALAESSVQAEAADLLHRRLGQIAMETDDLRQTEVGDQETGYYERLRDLEDERRNIEEYLRSFPKPQADNVHSQHVTPDISERVWEQIAAMQRIEPSIPAPPITRR